MAANERDFLGRCGQPWQVWTAKDCDFLGRCGLPRIVVCLVVVIFSWCHGDFAAVQFSYLAAIAVKVIEFS